MADFEKIKEKVDVAVSKAGQTLSELDMGVAYTKMEDVLSSLDNDGNKHHIREFIDSPKMDEIKSAGRTVRDFLGFVPNYAQSIPGMVKDGLEKLKKK